jgi:hypothetical protein
MVRFAMLSPAQHQIDVRDEIRIKRHRDTNLAPNIPVGDK